GYSLEEAYAFWRSTFAHNTIMVDEGNQAPVKSASLEWRPDADPPYAKGIIRDAYPGIRLERAILFDPPYVVIADRCESEGERRCGWVFHAYGSMDARVTEPTDPFDIPPLPTEGVFTFFKARRRLWASGQLEVNWRVSERIWLRLLALSDGPYEATVGRTPGNPLPDDRGTVVLRAVGRRRRFFAAFELNKGIPKLRRISLEDGGRIRIETADGPRVYALPIG
ncbi:hypothetical protein DRP77_09325, partial [Candidatus Poribacteria bacterium]